MNDKSKKLAFIMIALATVTIWLLLHHAFETQKEELAMQQKKVIALRQHEWAEEEVQRKLEVSNAEITRVQSRKNELRQALGGVASAAMKNPELSIGASIEQVARACTPTGARVRVRVERFTEFTLLLELPHGFQQRDLSETARCILSHCSDYVHRIRFISENSLAGEINRRAIESITNWQSVSLSQVDQLFEQLLTNRKTHNDSVASAPSNLDQKPDTQSTPQNPIEEERKERLAGELFKKSYGEALARTDLIQEQLEFAVDFGNVRTLPDLIKKRVYLDKAETLMKQARSVLEDPALEYQRKLNEAGVDELYSRILTRETEKEFKNSRPAVAAYFKALSERTRLTRGVVEVMTKNFSAWKYDLIDHGIRFQPGMENAAKECRQAFKILEQANLNLDRANKSCLRLGANNEK